MPPKKRGRPKKADGEPKFRFHGKKIGLTYSCPVDKDDNPIAGNKELLEELQQRWGMGKYVVAEEDHESGKRHYHVYMHLDTVLDKTKADFADVAGVHPNILKPGSGWLSYCKKHGNLLTNMENDAWTTALAKENAHEALEHLWAHKPADMCKNGAQIAANVGKRFKAEHKPAPLYYGPYPKYYYPDADMSKYSVCLWGPPETRKTQFARYYMAHAYGDYGFAKGGIESMKNIDTGKPFIYDEVDMHGKGFEPKDSREIVCVEQGGTVSARFHDVEIPPGVPRMFTSNMQWPFKNPMNAVYDRRVVMMHIPAFDAKDLPQFVEGVPLES